jgi:integrase
MTLLSYRAVLDNSILPALGSKEVQAITLADVEDLQEAMRAERKLSSSTINRVVCVLSQILDYGLKHGAVTSNVCEQVEAEPAEDTDVRPLTPDEIKRVIACARKHYQPLFTLLAYTGMRHGEAFALKWSDINFERREITINKSRVRAITDTPKTKAGRRIIEMLPPVIDALLPLRGNLNDFVFTTESGAPHNRPIDRPWHTALRNAGLDPRPAYVLRHSFATMLIQAGTDILTVSNFLGHADASITLKRYGRYITKTVDQTKLQHALGEPQYA